MTEKELNFFIEEMATIGDLWEPESVKRVYGNSTLEDALSTRKAELAIYFDILSKTV